MTDRAHRAITLDPDACTSCMICARECPSWCITLDFHAAVDDQAPANARERTVNVLDAFVIDWSLCMFCGICITECPFDALAWSADRLPTAETLTDLLAGIADLR